jgi:hypothetical protein
MSPLERSWRWEEHFRSRLIEEKRLRWFGHVKRMPGNRLPLKILEWEPEGTRRREDPKRDG